MSTVMVLAGVCMARLNLPWYFLCEKEIRLKHSESDLRTPLSTIAIAERLKDRKKEGSGGWKMGDRETNVGDGHCWVEFFRVFEGLDLV
jgi:hypothetical protein